MYRLAAAATGRAPYAAAAGRVVAFHRLLLGRLLVGAVHHLRAAVVVLSVARILLLLQIARRRKMPWAITRVSPPYGARLAAGSRLDALPSYRAC